MQDLGTLGGSFSNGYGINDSGQVSGYYLAESYHAFLWSPTTHNGTIGTMSDLGAGIGLGISDSGRVAGAVYDEVGGSNAVLYDGVTRFLGTLGGAVTVGNDVNARGQVTGYSETLTDATEHAFLWSPATPNGTTGSMSDLGAGIAIDINNVEQVTGRTGRAGFCGRQRRQTAARARWQVWKHWATVLRRLEFSAKGTESTTRAT